MHENNASLNSPTFDEIASFLREDICPDIVPTPACQQIVMLAHSPLGESTVFVHRSTYCEFVFIEVDIWGIAQLVPHQKKSVLALIDILNFYGTGGVLITIEDEVVYRQSIAVVPERPDCWQEHLRFMLLEGFRLSQGLRMCIAHDCEGANASKVTPDAHRFRPDDFDPTLN